MKRIILLIVLMLFASGVALVGDAVAVSKGEKAQATFAVH